MNLDAIKKVRPAEETVRNAFTKKITVNIKRNEDLNPIEIKVCGNDRKKVVVVEVWIGRQWIRYKEELQDIPNCSQSTTTTTTITTTKTTTRTAITTITSNSVWKYQPDFILILCPIVLLFST